MLLGIPFRTLTAHFLASSSAAGSKLERSKNLVQLVGGVEPRLDRLLPTVLHISALAGFVHGKIENLSLPAMRS
jgi:hypothetical protein